MDNTKMHYKSALTSFLLILAAALLSACGEREDKDANKDNDPEINEERFGLIVGSIFLDGASPEARARLQSAPASSTGSRRTVVAATATTGYIFAQASYTPVPPADLPEVATYRLTVPTQSGAAVIAVEPVEFNDSGFVFVGGHEPEAPIRFNAPTVVPISENPDGVRTDLRSCLALRTVNLSLAGAPNDMDALEDGMSCTLNATTRINGVDTIIARSRVFSLSRARLDQQPDPDFLVPTGFPVHVGVTCLFTPRANESGFPATPGLEDQNVTAFGSRTGEFTASCESPSTQPDDLELLIQRGAGTIHGYLDVVGFNEERANFTIHPNGGDTLSMSRSYAVDATPPHELILDRLGDSNRYQISPDYLSIHNSSLILSLPDSSATTAPEENGETIADIGNRYVTDTSLVDVQWRFDMNTVTPNGFEISPDHMQVDGHWIETRFTLQGNPGLIANLPDGFTATNGDGAKVTAIPEPLGQGRYGASMPIFGLSPADGAADGSDTGVIEWTHGRTKLHLASENHDVGVDFQTRVLERFLNAVEPHYQAVENEMCFGRYRLRVQSADDIVFTRGATRLLGGSETLDVDANGDPVPYERVSGEIVRADLPPAEQRNFIDIDALLPAYTVYQGAFRSAVADAPTDDEATMTEVAFERTIAMPLNGEPLGCGVEVADCITADGTGALSVTAPDRIEVCANVAPSIDFTVRSDSGPIGEIQIYIDGRPWRTISQNRDEALFEATGYGLDEIPPTASILTIIAKRPGANQDSDGCVASKSVPIDRLPGLTMVCPTQIGNRDLPEPISVFIPNGVPAEVVNPLLEPRWENGCQGQVPPAVSITGPDPYPIGEVVIAQVRAPDPNNPDATVGCEVPVHFIRPLTCVVPGANSARQDRIQSVSFGDVDFDQLDGEPRLDVRPPEGDGGRQQGQPLKGVFMVDNTFVSFPRRNSALMFVTNRDLGAEDWSMTAYRGPLEAANVSVDAQLDAETLELARQIYGPNIGIEPYIVTLSGAPVDGVLFNGSNELTFNAICY